MYFFKFYIIFSLFIYINFLAFVPNIELNKKKIEEICISIILILDIENLRIKANRSNDEMTHF